MKGVCCEYCTKCEKDACPIQTASPWSRWKDFCSAFDPDRNEPNARSLPEKGDKHVNFRGRKRV